ncbi:MAG: recombination protein RecR [Candidatus Aminicenantes bacterium RBG_13_62_12]|nr:MAG: recombination protein RecR [Candidatus Aminicenantes bacterium RBG_13_62_12]
MFEYARPLHRLIEELRRIPGLGAKTAQRIAFHVLSLPQEEADSLAEAITQVRQRLFYCSVCNNITHVDPCSICTDADRTDAELCVVEEPYNISSIEKTGAYRGRYHVLLGTLAPLKGKGPDNLGAEKLLERVRKGRFQEVILATNPTVEGEATAHYLAGLLRGHPLRLTRLAMGLPVGADMDFADQVTMRKALEGRTELRD